MELDRKILFIKNLISKDQLKRAFEEFDEMTANLGDEEFEKQVIIQRSNYHSLTKERINALSTWDSINVRENQIKWSLLEILSNIKTKHLPYKNIDFYFQDQSTQERTSSIANKAKIIFDLTGGQVLRQKAINSSFSIPNRDLSDRIWKEWPKERNYHADLRAERFWLERHLLSQYGKLIIMPAEKTTYKIESPKYALVRLKILHDFILTNRERIDVVTISEGDVYTLTNLTIIGDSFYAESEDRVNDGWGNTLISTKDVAAKIKTFDDEFHELLDKKGLDIFSSRQTSLKEIKDEMDKLESRINQ